MDRWSACCGEGAVARRLRERTELESPTEPPTCPQRSAAGTTRKVALDPNANGRGLLPAWQVGGRSPN
jgi:hypothetical protein